MRQFLLLAHRVPVNGSFTLNDLAGGGGRMDEVARVVSTAFTLSNDLRRDTTLTILFAASPPPAARRVRLLGEKLRYLNPDERSTAALLKNALVRSVAAEHEIESSPGLFVGPVDPMVELRNFAASRGTWWLSEDGVPAESTPVPSGGLNVVLSDPDSPTGPEAEVLRASGAVAVSLGPLSLRSSQCVDVLHNLLDRRAPPAGPGDRPTGA